MKQALRTACRSHVEGLPRCFHHFFVASRASVRLSAREKGVRAAALAARLRFGLKGCCLQAPPSEELRDWLQLVLEVLSSIEE